MLLPFDFVFVYHFRGVPSASTPASYHQIWVQATLTVRWRSSIFYFYILQFENKFHVTGEPYSCDEREPSSNKHYSPVICSVFTLVEQYFPIDNKDLVQFGIQSV